MIPTKNDKSAISAHASRANAKDKPSIGSMLSLLVGRTRSAGNELANNKAWEVVS
jgi:hypothetical protein